MVLTKVGIKILTQFELILIKNFLKFPKEYRDISWGFEEIYAKSSQTC